MPRRPPTPPGGFLKTERNAKIVATLGPASSGEDEIRRLIAAGVDVFRLNFSHGSHADHAERIARVRRAAEGADRPVALLLDLQGPKIRTGKLAGGRAVELVEGRALCITTEDVEGSAERVGTSYAALPGDVRRGDRILVSDGKIELRVESSSGHDVVTTVVQGGLLAERQGINLPGVAVSAPALTDKDREDLHFGLEQGVDFVALSFVRSAADVKLVKAEAASVGRTVPVIAKIERPEALDVLDEILDAADGVMVARGDLGVELAPERVPVVQKRIIAAANCKGKPVITATQMLESMIEQPHPTRAEASDVANAILDGSDAVMLSGETAVGRYAVKAVQTMARIACEMHDAHRDGVGSIQRDERIAAVDSNPEAIAAALAALVRALPRIAAIYLVTQSGSTARLVSQHRPRVPIVAFTPDAVAWRRMALLWGVTAIHTETVGSGRELEEQMLGLALARGLGKPGQTVVLTGSHPFHMHAPTNFLKLATLPG